MPRNGSGVYSLPAGTEAIPGQTIQSADYNTVNDDLEADANAKRPVAAGGTGADNATDARLNLDAQQLDADLTSLAGLGYSARSTVVKTAANTWTLVPQTTFGDSLLALTDAAGLKSAAGLGNVDNTSDANKPVSTAQAAALLAKAGGTMTGDLIINKSTPVLSLQESGTLKGQLFVSGTSTGLYAGVGQQLDFYTNNVLRGSWSTGGVMSFTATPTVSSDPVMTRGATETITGAKTFGNGTGSASIKLDGGNSTSQGSVYNWYTAGALNFALGNYSAIVGGAYDKDPTFYSGTSSPTLYWYDGTKRPFIHTGNAGSNGVHRNPSYSSGTVTYSTSAPSGGSDGDIWFQYS